MPPKRATRSTNSVSKTSAPSAPAPKRGAKRSAPVEANLPSASKRAKNGIKAEDAEDEEHKCDHGSQSDSELSDLEDEDSDAGVKKPAAKKKAVAKGKVKTEEKEETGNKRKRKTQEEKDAEMVPLAARTKALKMFVGAHVSAAKGVQNAVTNCAHIGGNAFALFLKSQRKWDNPELKAENRDLFREACKEHGYNAASHILPHGSYLVNLANEDPDMSKKAYASFLDDLKRCEALGIKLYNFHPGATGTSPLPAALKRIADRLTSALNDTSTVMPVLETMCGSGSVIGSRLEDLATIISHIPENHRSRIGICIDTCHAFAAGADLRHPETFKAFLSDFDDVIGMKYLKALHLNDSKVPLGAKRDLHANIGTGFLGLRAFWNVMNEPRFENLPLILETPCDVPDPKDKTGKKKIEDRGVWAREIKLLEGLIGMDVDSEEFKTLEKKLADEGKSEREKFAAQVQKKEAEEKRKLEKGQKSLKDMLGGKAKGKAKKGKAKEESDDDESS